MSIKWILMLATLAYVSAQTGCPVLYDDTYYLVAGNGYTLDVFVNDTGVDMLGNTTVIYSGFAFNGTCMPANITYYNTTNGNTTTMHSWTNYDLVNVFVNGSLFVFVSNTVQEGERCVVFSSCNTTSGCCSNATAWLNVEDVPRCTSSHATIVNITQCITLNMQNYVIDPSGYLLSINVTGGPFYGNYSINGTYLTYCPYPTFTADDTLNYTACDNDMQCTQCMFNFDIAVAPNCSNAVISIIYPQSGSVNVYNLDVDVDNSNVNKSLQFTSLTLNPYVTFYGNFTTSLGGSIFYGPGPNYTSTDTSNYTICDFDDGLCSTCRVDVVSTAVQTCNNDFANAFYKQGIFIYELANDANLQYAPNTWTVALITMPTLGIATIVNGSIYYNATSTNGTDIFFYNVTAPSGQTANCSIDVTVQSYPVCMNHNSTFSYGQNYTVNVTSDFSPSNSTLVVLLYSNMTSGGHFVATVGNPVYAIQFSPGVTFDGQDTIVYKICDTSNTCSNCSFVVTIVGNITCKNDSYTFMNGQTDLLNVLSNDVYNSANASLISMNISSLSPSSAGNITLLPNDTVKFDISMGYIGMATFNYTIYDSTSGSTCTVTLNLVNFTVTTATPTTAIPTTAIPTTALIPTTGIPTTAIPTTAVPTTAIPTTAIPTTGYVTTAVVSAVVTTAQPTFIIPEIHEIHIGEDSLGATFSGMGVMIVFAVAIVVTFITRRFSAPLAPRNTLGINPSVYDNRV
jgi:hypothetical protein